ncbi:N-acetylmuramoyl-L-alanine amidase [Streptomyces sp. NPDC060286]|uniref:N-acetylmuramoyl-L-alanine amidase n=1 Tax=unclassified Streptomyces TaxID=2593676 RepID=UPI0035DD8978
MHHTVTKDTSSTVAMVRDGYASLPGPLCHGMIAKDGTVHMVGWGRTNHAGGGDPRVLEQVIAESYGTRPTPPTKGNSNGVDGNSRFYGWECENLGDGKDPWPKAQYDAIVRVQAALCRAHGWTAKSVIGHLEWSSDKVDPRGFPMATRRADAAERLKHPASWSPGTTTPTPPKETPVSTTDDRVKALHANLLSIGEIGTTAKGTESGRVEHGAGYFLAHILNEVRQLRVDVAALKKEK